MTPYVEALDHSLMLKPLVTNVSNLGFWLDGDATVEGAKDMDERLHLLLDNCPKLDTLDLYSYNIQNEDDATNLVSILSQAGAAQLFNNLTCLRLNDLNVIGDSNQGIMRHLDVPKLEELSLHRCSQLVPLIKSFTTFFASNSGRLSELQLVLRERMNEGLETVHAFEKLLMVCPKLSVLEIDLSCHSMVSKESILSHADTLITLILGTGSSPDPRYISVDHVREVVRGCGQLEELAMNLPSVHLGNYMDGGICFQLTPTAGKYHPRQRSSETC
jgi:hypothetical protein